MRKQVAPEPSFYLRIRMGNAAFAEHPEAEVARILRKVAEDVERGYMTAHIFDRNGNTVGDYGPAQNASVHL